MTDKDTLIEMFNRAKIEYELSDNCIIVEAGYIGFYSEFEFDAEGNLLKVEAFE